MLVLSVAGGQAERGRTPHQLDSKGPLASAMLMGRAGLCKNLWVGSGDGRWAEGHRQCALHCQCNPNTNLSHHCGHVLGRSQLWYHKSPSAWSADSTEPVAAGLWAALPTTLPQCCRLTSCLGGGHKRGHSPEQHP